MQLYSETGEFKLYHGSMIDMLQVIAPCSVDSIVTDPPYELNFMNKGWDNSGIAFQADTWRKCYQVLKSGGYLLAFGGSRTFHRIACAIEDAGFEIRDTIMWLYGSGFPKSMNIGKAVEAKVLTGSANTQEFKNLQGTKAVADDLGYTKMQHQQGARPNDYSSDGHLRLVDIEYQTSEGRQWDGWGTALKPAYEPVIVARKPCEGSCVDNVMRYRTGAINIDGCRIATDDKLSISTSITEKYGRNAMYDSSTLNNPDREQHPLGRYPSNVVLTYDDTDKEEVCGGMPETGEECAARYFYCAKASKRDRDEGLQDFKEISTGELQGGRKEGSAGSMMLNADGTTRVNPYAGGGTPKRNTHPTVKPCDLMQYLVRLVTPPHGTVLDPFNGSGSTGKAAMYENKDHNAGYKYIGIELTAEYLPIADARIRYAAGDNSPVEYHEEPAKGQITFFDLLGGET